LKLTVWFIAKIPNIGFVSALIYKPKPTLLVSISYRN
jgi:hypothetical protein